MVFVVLCCSFGQAQDIHFSQFFNSPLNLNPAECGNFQGDYRFVGNHKQQWNTFENAYTTFSFSVDKMFMPEKTISPGVGFLLNNDVAGDGNFGTLRLELPLSVSFVYGKNRLALGVSPAFVRHGINFNALYFGNQYNGNYFDPNIHSGENFEYDNFSFFDLSSGFFYRYQKDVKTLFDIGFSVNHLLTPIKSFSANDKLTLSLRWQCYAQSKIPIDNKITLEPSILYMKQGTYQEFDFGSSVCFQFNPVGLRSVYAGLFTRLGDAGIAMVGADYNGVKVQLSYDVNLSKLRTVSRGRGGVELSIIYVLSKVKLLPVNTKKRCPDFM